MRNTIIAAALIAAAQPVDAQDVVGSVTATIAAEEFAFVVINDGEPSSSFERVGGDVVVEIVAVPDRTPTEPAPLLELTFEVAGIGPTAEASNAAVSLTDPDGRMLSTGAGTSDVSLTAFALEEDSVTVAGNFASQLQNQAGAPETAVEGDFQASIRQTDFAPAD